MEFQRTDLVYYCLLVSFLFQNVAFGEQKNYIVYLGSHSHGITQLSNHQDIVQAVTESHYNLLGSLLGSERARDALGYSYTWNINGFSATLEEEEAAQLSKQPGVVSVFLDQGRKLHTTRSWDYMSLENHGADHPGKLWKAANFGEGTIIATLDTGVWPESKSFNDKGYGPVPPKWRGICQNNTKVGVPCNRKLIGARFFSKGYISAGGKPEDSFVSARDSAGHGSHTLSTAAGNFVPQAKILNSTVGIAKGGSPKARVAAYKVCWPPIDGNECFDSDILAGFDAAINDGVDVISVSLGGDPADYFEDSIAIGTFHAVKNGIDVACSAGNGGPDHGTVSNVAPWITTVAASTLDRKLEAYAQLHNGLRIQVLITWFNCPLTFYRLIMIIFCHHSLLCKAKTLDPKKTRGKIVVCLRGGNGRLETGIEAASAGAVGMIFCNNKTYGDELIADPHYLPAVHISYKDSLLVYHYINSTKHPQAYISPLYSKLNIKPTPVMAVFSSAGPNSITPQIIKPDITAPGVNIIAAYTEAKQTGTDADPRKFPYNILSGTSMSCPHVAGVIGLLRTLYPHWSPAAIRSAIMTTARTRDNTQKPIQDFSKQKATPFNYGSGHIRPNKAMDPGLVYDLTEVDYLNFLCARGYNQTILRLFTDSPYKCSKHTENILNLNYPSIAVPRLPLKGSITVTRKVKNVENKPATYAVSIKEPEGVSISVKPKVLKFNKVGEEKEFQVKLKAKWGGNINKHVFGRITWTDGVHYVRSPVAISHA
ncbi:Subtilisin-like protease SBT5.4 [Linum perenne]